MKFAQLTRLALAAALLFAASCSDDSDVSTSKANEQTEVSACDLVTTEEATAAMRKPMADGEETDTEGGTLCTWFSTDPPSEGLDNPTKLEVALLPLRPAARQLIDTLATSPEHRVVPGLGDLAAAECTFGDTDHCSELYVVLGDQYLVIDMGNFAWPGDYERPELLGIVTEVAGHAILRVRR